MTIDESGVSRLTGKSGDIVSTRSTSDVFPTIKLYDTLDNNRQLICVSARVAAEMVHGAASGTEGRLAFFDEDGLENQIVPLSAGFVDTGNVLQFGEHGKGEIGIMLDSDACNVASVAPLAVAAAPEDDGEVSTQPESANIFDNGGERTRRLNDEHPVPSSKASPLAQVSQADILARHRAVYIAHRRALQAGTTTSKPGSDGINSRKLLWFPPIHLDMSQSDFDNFAPTVAIGGSDGGGFGGSDIHYQLPEFEGNFFLLMFG